MNPWGRVPARLLFSFAQNKLKGFQMIAAQNDKVIALAGPVTIATNAATTAVVDVRGFGYAVFDIALPPATATNSSAKFGVLTLTEGDTTSSYAAATGFTGTTNSTAAAGEFVLPVQNNTSVAAVHRLYVDLKNRKRYLKLSVQAPASHTTIYAQCRLSRAATAPDTDTERGNTLTVIG
jgi:hypothetical protein